jgi:hydroxymethylbilane synthase
VSRSLRVATRGSAQARTQAQVVAGQLRNAHPDVDVELVFIKTTGDERQDVPLHVIGGQGVFVKEVEQAVLDGRAELAVHSAKDLPSTVVEGLVIGAVTERRNPRDALIGCTFNDLPRGATVATGSVRRRAQLAARRPDLHFQELRGNIETRLGKVPDGGAIVMALAALEVLGRIDEVSRTLVLDVVPLDVMVPQVGQGAVAVECRADDAESRAMLASIEHGPSRAAVDCERAFLAELGSGCALPVGAHAVVSDADAGTIRLLTFLAGESGVYEGVHEGSADDAPSWAAEGARLARKAVMS